MSTPNRAIYACGNCDERGHTRDTCERPDTRHVSPLFVRGGGLAAYRENRRNELCTDCGVPSRRSRCRRCSKRRCRWPSRGRVYRRREK